MRPGKRKMDDASAGGPAARTRSGKRAPAQPGRRSAPTSQPGDLGWMPLSFWYAVVMLVIEKERWAFWRFILRDALVEYSEGKGCVLEVESAPDASTFNKTGVTRDVHLRTQLQPTSGGGAKSGCSEAAKRLGGGWAIAYDDADARERLGVCLPLTALLMPDLPPHRAAKVWHCAISNDARGILTETAPRTMPEVLGLAVRCG